ncbi:MAG: cytochrome c oxidase subunit 3 [Pseudomonadota bacterium]
MASHAPAAPNNTRYFVPDPSAWPFMLTAGLALLIVGVWSYLEDKSLGSIPLYVGGLFSAFIIFRWFRGVALESERGAYGKQVDMTYRMAMAWFIFSEVMFFAAFFGALYYARTMSVPWIGGEGAKGVANIQWPGFEASWPTNGPAALGGAFQNMSAWGLPFINTCLLLTSGITITMAHHAIKLGKRTACIAWMWATVALGVVFLYCQVIEYIHAYQELNLTLGSGVYGSTFFMLTGFHGMHVTLGTLMLFVITCRLMKGHFKPESHFGFEGVAWYWHFVDVVWVGLFIFVYIL